MKIKTLILSSIVLIPVSTIIYFFFIIDQEIKWQYKLIHYVFSISKRLYGIEGDFNRKTFNIFKDLLFKLKSNTNNQFINGVLIEDLIIQSRWKEDPYKNKEFMLKIYIPDKANNSQYKFPILVHIHGGGFVIDYDDKKSYHFSKENLVVISIQYRLAPEHKYPSALEDCYSVMEWLSEFSHPLLKKYADINKIALIGDSAGGNLVSVLPYLIRDRKLPLKISHQILIYPAMMIDELTESVKRIGPRPYILSVPQMKWYYHQYAGDIKNYSDNPLINPLKATNFSELPPAMTILATEDILYSEGKEYAELLRNNGIDSYIKEYKSVHGFFSFFEISDERNAFYDIIDYLKARKFIDS